MAKKSKPDFVRLNAEIMAALDVAAEYKALGVDVTGKQPSAKGWVSCRAMGREDHKPSAAINIKSGQYVDLGGDRESYSLWDFAAKYGPHEDWKAARKHFAEKAGVDIGRARGSKNPSDEVVDRRANQPAQMLMKLWAMNKPGVTLDAVLAAGGCLASYPAKTKRNVVVALPVYGPKLVAEEPCGWVVFDSGGLNLPIWGKDGQVIDTVKMKTVAGSQSGLMGRDALAALAISDGEKTIWKVEGPTDMMALWSIIPESQRDTHLVVCNSGGSTENVRPEIAALFVGHRVFVLHDADKAGEVGAAKWLVALGKVARELRQVRLPYEIEESRGKDLRDWIVEQQQAGVDAGMIYSDLIQWAKGEPIYSAGPRVVEGATEDADGDKDDGLVETRIAESLQIDVLGERDNGSIVLFAAHPARRRTAELRDIDRLGYPKLLQIAGPPVKACVDETGEESYNRFSIFQVRNAIGYLAGKKRIGDQTLSGVGCWQPKDDGGDDAPGVVVVGAGESAEWDGSKLKRIVQPRAGGRLLDLSSGEPWYHFPQLEANLAACESTDWTEKVIEQAIETFNRWRWEHQEIAPSLVTGLVLASWVQAMWHWRPQVAILGATKTGKSVLFETLGGIFNGLAISSSKSTAAGIRQAIGTTGKVALCDEFEDSKHRREVLEMIRASSRGDEILRGTTGQRTKKFVTQHIFWVAAIEVGLSRAPDRNRFISLELLPPLKKDEGQLNTPPTSELHELGQKLLAIAIRNVVPSRPLTRRLKAVSLGADPRVVESYAVPAAILAASVAMSEEGARGMLAKMLETAHQEEQQTSDEAELLQAIFRAEMRTKDGRSTLTVAEALNGGDIDSIEALQRHGMTTAYDSRAPRATPGEHDTQFLFLDPKAVGTRLLRGSEWEGQDLKAILRRLPGAEVTRRRLGHRRPFGVLIPMEVLRRDYLADPNE